MKNPIAQSYQIMDRIGFVKRMISTHQRKLITEPKRSSSHLDTSQTHTDLIRRTRDSTSASDYMSCNDGGTKKLLREELRITKSLLDKRTIELSQCQQDLNLCRKDLQEQQKLREDMHYDMKKLTRERDELKEELAFKLRKIDNLSEELQRLERANSQMLGDLKEARQVVQEVKAFEQELKTKEKQLLIDWQKLEKDKAALKEKQNHLLQAEGQLSAQAEQLQILKNRLNIQEKKVMEVQQERLKQLQQREDQLQQKEQAMDLKEWVIESQAQQKDEVEKKEQLLSWNEELWKKRVQVEMSKIKEVQSKLKIMK